MQAADVLKKLKKYLKEKQNFYGRLNEKAKDRETIAFSAHCSLVIFDLKSEIEWLKQVE